MKASDFNLQRDIKFDMENGITTFKDDRLVILDAGAFGLLRKRIIEQIGLSAARDLFFQFGYQQGYAEFMQMKMNYQFDSPQDLLAAGPVMHTWQGEVHATPKEFRMDPKKQELFFTGVWRNSYEAEQHLCFHKRSKDPVCWSLAGFASGWATGFMGNAIHIALEPVCMGKGDDHCEWDIRPAAAWGAKGKKYLKLIEELRR